MAIPVARVHLAMAHAALPGLLPTPPKCAMLPLLPTPPCAAAIVVLPSNSSPPRPSRADAAGRWDAHKTKPAGGSPALSSSSSSSGSQRSLGSSNKKVVTRTSSASTSSARADSEERWDTHKTPAASPAASSESSCSNKTKTCHISRRRPNGGRAPSSAAERWDAHKNGRRSPPADEVDDGESSSTGSNDVESDDMARQPLPRSLYAGPGFVTSPEPSMLPKPSVTILISVA
ncbi:unnamed protein product [Urochloa humidicola]